MAIRTFKGFAGTQLCAHVSGSSDDPAVLLVHGVGGARADWAGVAEALVKAGRFVINLDLRGHGESERANDARYDFEAYVEDVKSVLSQMAVRPAIIAASSGGLIAASALVEGGAHLAAGLIIVDGEGASSLDTGSSEEELISGIEAARDELVSADAIPLPVLLLRDASASAKPALELVGAFSNAEQEVCDQTDSVSLPDTADTINAVLLSFLERRIPRVLPDYISGSDPRTLRDALGCFATGVTVVTACDVEGAPVGLTANSFTSVSLEPPLLLVCIAKTSSSLRVLERAENFAVNVLQIGQQPVSNVFAKSGEDRFSQTSWEPGENGAPILTGALVNFECRRHAMHDGGDHVILVGQVERARYEPRRDPLLYFKGKYRRLHFA